MSTAVATPPTLRANNFRRFSLTDRTTLGDDRTPSVHHRPVSSYDFVQRRKSTSALRNRNSWRQSWRNSWKNILPKTLNSTQGLKSKRKNGKKYPDSVREVTEESVNSRKRMDDLLRLWHSEVVDSSDESSDDSSEERLLTNRRRSCSPRVIGDSTSSSEDECTEAPVSLYVSEGPSRMIFADPGTSDQVESRTGVSLPGEYLAHEMGAGERLLERNSDKTLGRSSNVLTGLRTRINHSCNKNNVIASTQINNLERSCDNMALVDPTCLVSLSHHNFGNSKLGITSGNTATEGMLSSSARCEGHRKVKGKKYAKDDLEMEKYRHAQQGVNLEGVIKMMCKNRLSMSLENTNLKLENEKLIKTRRNNDTSVRLEQSTTGDDRFKSGKNNMDSGFTTQDLNAIRRFLGLSLQQINASKIVDNGNHSNNTEAPPVTPTVNKQDDQSASTTDQTPKTTKDVVPDYPSTYPKSDETIEQKTLNHDQNSCDLQCEFKEFGCQFTAAKCALALENHMKTNLKEHLSLVSKTAIAQKKQLQEQNLVQQRQQFLIREMIETIRNLKQLIDEQTRKNETQAKLVSTLKDQLREQRKQSQQFERDISHQFQTLNQSTAIMSLPRSHHTAEMLWPIKNFTKFLKQVRDKITADPIIGESFYSEQHGYKLCLWVYINGRGNNLGNSVSVYTRILPGEHDGILNWPVRPTYTFTLFDQSDGEKENIVRTRRVNSIKKEGEKYKGIERPGGGDRSVIVGFDDFITHEQLFKGNYLKDDCFYLKIEATLDY